MKVNFLGISKRSLLLIMVLFTTNIFAQKVVSKNLLFITTKIIDNNGDSLEFPLKTIILTDSVFTGGLNSNFKDECVGYKITKKVILQKNNTECIKYLLVRDIQNEISRTTLTLCNNQLSFEYDNGQIRVLK